MEMIQSMLSLLLSLSFVTLAGYGDGITDSGINKEGFHWGDKNDKWHWWSRAQTISAFLAGVCALFTVYMNWMMAIGGVVPALCLFFIGFRFAVYKNGKYLRWYPKEEGLKGALSKLLLKTIRLFS